eukprot:CAMPEP_0168450614 /NCGR_PEP_ID=MMETSP0228-20121227/48210_1 /TAXON_ID=133427 /ORGANISM="Protoceratium reticulatum, Strain CCCM 535 (=CCMP 1889)" /LENGTH=84 /DNA_ID=CAMNT_0008465203 /DNA_START=173 /DNA_END=425 /DNA_ORIENTATION=+
MPVAVSKAGQHSPSPPDSGAPRACGNKAELTARPAHSPVQQYVSHQHQQNPNMVKVVLARASQQATGTQGARPGPSALEEVLEP